MPSLSQFASKPWILKNNSRIGSIRECGRRSSMAIFVGMLLLTSTQTAKGLQPNRTTRFQAVSQEEAWKLLPQCEEGAGQKLPAWALVLVTSMPYTTASMLELDTIYRTSDELDHGFRARLRWTAAMANGCEYTAQYALSDMKRAGMSDDEAAQFVAGTFKSSPEEKYALQFVRGLTLKAYQVTDEQFAALSEGIGERQTMAVVLQTAYATFQDRMMQTLGVDVEPGGPLVPLNLRFAAVAADQKIVMPRPDVPHPATLPDPVLEIPADWTTAFSFDQLQAGMAKQRARPERISIPAWGDVQSRIPQHIYPVKKATRIKWSLCVLGHQPMLGAAWLRTMKTWRRESGSDDVFNESLFWVVTRNLQCFY